MTTQDFWDGQYIFEIRPTGPNEPARIVRALSFRTVGKLAKTQEFSRGPFSRRLDFQRCGYPTTNALSPNIKMLKVHRENALFFEGQAYVLLLEYAKKSSVNGLASCTESAFRTSCPSEGRPSRPRIMWASRAVAQMWVDERREPVPNAWFDFTPCIHVDRFEIKRKLTIVYSNHLDFLSEYELCQLRS
jgi:hypothetical protein